MFVLLSVVFNVEQIIDFGNSYNPGCILFYSREAGMQIGWCSKAIDCYLFLSFVCDIIVYVCYLSYYIELYIYIYVHYHCCEL